MIASGGGWVGLEFEADAFGLLEDGDDFEQGGGARVAGGAKHSHRGFGRALGAFAKRNEADGGVDGVAEDGFTRGDFTRNEAGEALAEEFMTKLRIALGAGEDGFAEVFCQRHSSFPVIPQ